MDVGPEFVQNFVAIVVVVGVMALLLIVLIVWGIARLVRRSTQRTHFLENRPVSRAAEQRSMLESHPPPPPPPPP